MKRGTFALGLALLLAAPAPAHAVRVVTWNLLNYDTTPSANTVSERQHAYRTVMANIDADIVILQELKTVAARDSFLTGVLDVVQPGEWTASSAVSVNAGEYMAVMWKPAKVGIPTVTAIPTSGPRLVLLCVVKPVGYLTKAGWFRLYSFHLKAGGPGTADSTTRRLECTDIRNNLNNFNTATFGTNFLIGGDSNFYGSYEGGYQRLTESQANNQGRCVDPLGGVMGGSQNWHVISGFALYHSQAPSTVAPPYPNPPGFSGGGMDDRFDLLFGSTSLADGQGLELLQSFAYGQDGRHFDGSINGPPTNSAVGQTIADSLWGASDHLPVVAVLQLPARVVAASQLDFGSVLVGATAQQALTVSNGVAAPGDALDYSFGAAPAGFTAPAGSFSAAAGAGNLHTLEMSTASAGLPSGTLALATDDPDSLSKSVLLSGRVLRHAVASLDSLVVTPTGTLDFGTQDPGAFADLPVNVFNQGFDGLQARLSLDAAGIAGGAGRFSLAGGFTPVLVADHGQPFAVHLDDAGATPDSTYEATLTFSSSDEPLPGAQPAGDLVVTLRATRSVTGVPGGGPPAALAFYPPRPNPSRGSCRFAFDLPRRAPVELAIFDLGGRRVTSLVSGVREAGRYQPTWNAGDASGGRVPAGLYFARFSTPGLQRTARLVVIP